VLDFEPLSNPAKPSLNPPEFFYFQHDGKVFPVLVLSYTGAIGSKKSGTLTIILAEKLVDGDRHGDGTGVLESLTKGEPVVQVGEWVNLEAQSMPPDCKMFVQAGMTGWDYQDGWQYPGCGTIWTKP
jgi:peptidoglycan hydrolase-like protein with peptidoglycan-binding domain